MNPQQHEDTSYMIDNEMKRDKIKCSRCWRVLKIWHKCPYCQVIYLCDCYRGPLCDCITEISEMRVIIDRMKQLST